MADLYDLKRIAADIGLDYYQLYRLLVGQDALRSWLGEVRSGGKGKPAEYPEESYPKFRQIADLKRQGLTNAAIAQALVAPEQTGPIAQTEGTAIALPQMELAPDQARLVAALQRVLVPDKLLTLKEAREETGLPARTIKRLPAVEGQGRYPKWRRHVLLAYLRTL